MTAAELLHYLHNLGPVPANTVDKIIVGHPSTAVKKIGTCWMPYWSTLREAAEQGVNVMVVHEPTFYTHLDLDEVPHPAYAETVEAKKAWIEAHGMVIIRCHDMLDAVPEWGMPYIFGHTLGFKDSDIIASRPYYHVYRIPETPAGAVAQHVARSLRHLRQRGVEFYGDESRLVHSVGVGTGCFCNPQDVMDMGAELHIAIPDTIRTWIQGPFSEDTGLPLVLVHHGSTESTGMEVLGQRIQKDHPGLEVVHFAQGCGSRWIMP